jgi:hypothetical protein
MTTLTSPSGFGEKRKDWKAVGRRLIALARDAKVELKGGEEEPGEAKIPVPRFW